MTEVPLPANLVFYGRLSNPGASLKVMSDWARVPEVDPRVLLEGLVTAMTRRKADAPLASVIDAAQPLDVAASFEVRFPPRALGAFSAAITNLDAARSALAGAYDLREGDRGVVRLAPRGGRASAGAPEDDADDDADCELAPSAGSAPYRLVCGSSAAALAALGPYLTRTTPRRSVPVDAHFELHAETLGGFAAVARAEGPRLLGGLFGVNAATEPARADLFGAALGDAFDLVGDLDAVTLDASLDPAHAGLVARTRFKSTASLVARLAAAHPEQVAPAPPSFWRLPGDVDAASFGSGIDDADVRHPRELLVAAIDEALAGEKATATERAALTALVGEALIGTRGCAAHGRAAGGTYSLIEWNEGSARIVRAVRDLVSANARPGLARWLPSAKLASPLRGLPAGAVHALVAAKPAHPTDAPPPVYHLVVLPDGPRTWVALSTSEAPLRAALSAVRQPAGSPSGESLGGRATARGLDGLRDGRMSAGGFITLRALVDTAREAKPDRDVAWSALLGRLPSRGVTPALFRSAPLAPTSDAPAGAREVALDLPVDFIRDAAGFVLQAE